MAQVSGGPSPGRIDTYRLEQRLAVGGMAEIFLAVDERDGRRVALKKILPQIASDPDFLNRFFHEIRIQIALKHRNVVELLDCSPGAANAYIVMEYVDGGSLATLLEKAGKFPWELALHAADEALRGLGAAHKKGIVHRDVKPQNLMWTRDGTVKVADFGISTAEHLTRLTVTGTVVGTPSFMSPEQARGEPLDGRSDLFSVGTVLYGLLTGLNPFTADSVAATLVRVANTVPDPPTHVDPTLPDGVDRILRRLHAKDRQGRYATAEEASEAIRALLAKEGAPRPGEAFREFVADPGRYVETRRRRLAEEALHKAEALLNDRNAPPEEALWAAYQTMVVAPADTKAKEVFRSAASRAGQRESPVENPKIRELEEKIRQDPENVALMLQLAKLYRLEKDFVNVMRFFRKLQLSAAPDAYTQAQIAALVGSAAPAPKRAGPPAGPGPGRRAPVPEPQSPGTARRSLWMALGGGSLAVLALGVWWMNGPAKRITGESEEDKKRAEAILRLLEGSGERPASAGAAPERPLTPEEALQRVLDRGERLEAESGPATAVAFYREAAERLAPAQRGAAYLAMAEAAARAGDRASAVEAFDAAAALGGPGGTTARLRKGAFLEQGGERDAARALYDEIARTTDGPGRWTATLRLGLMADAEGDPARALVLYEEILARAPSAPEADPARLGAAAIYRSEGRHGDARRLYEEVLRNAPPGSDLARSAEQGLSTVP